MTLQNLLYLSEHQFSHLKDGNKQSSQIRGSYHLVVGNREALGPDCPVPILVLLFRSSVTWGWSPNLWVP